MILLERRENQNQHGGANINTHIETSVEDQSFADHPLNACGKIDMQLTLTDMAAPRGLPPRAVLAKLSRCIRIQLGKPSSRLPSPARESLRGSNGPPSVRAQMLPYLFCECLVLVVRDLIKGEQEVSTLRTGKVSQRTNWFP
ncbi:hypothetical protein EYF80_050232 [Liparis tanakae]|uniref:Uncharacterized protein n=1 Tax=Liparis tanakae TaxID=230148 RepID=A0A4Z2FGV9_9TELE|nr:hypothetical protein EYF80_050232 [Liparis tanakae]